uniref:Peptidase S54 rhomboid domain-containing protein n=1 Tax=Picocystis salinarum TaxID=88271 RepID=A0A7S3U8L9_9CHLO
MRMRETNGRMQRSARMDVGWRRRIRTRERRKEKRVAVAKVRGDGDGNQTVWRRDGNTNHAPGYGGTFALVMANAVMYALDHGIKWEMAKTMYLNHASWKWWQVVTSTFCHASWSHLSGNLFLLYIFGRLVEEEEGAFGVVMAYLICGAAASLASLVMLPRTSAQGFLGMGNAPVFSVGASGAVFGLFAVAVMVKMMKGFSFRKLLEAGILGQFVVEKLLGEVHMQANGGSLVAGASVNHIAHISGALAGVFLIFLLTRLPSDKDPSSTPSTAAP